MRLTFLVLSFISIISTSLYAQSDDARDDYALLWEISGNGLEKPSYLFGSMHIRKEFAFEFPDSILHYLSRCEAFANEVHLDSAMLRMFEIYVGNDELRTDSSYINFIKTKKIEKDTSISNKETLFSNLFSEDTNDEDELVSVKNKPTMLDAYLMNIAKSLGKELYGLEKIDNHLYDSGEDTATTGFSLFNTTYEDLEKQYFLGDLEGIQKIIQKEAASFDDLELIPRNYIMLESMMRIMAQKSLFSVVGAAHLPGKEGVIELLRAEGYHLRKVTPVFSQLLVSSGERKKMNKARPWIKIKEDGARFDLSTPLPYLFKNNAPFESNYLQADVGNGLFYLLLTSSMTPNDFDDFDNYFFTLDNYEIIHKSSFSVNGINGYKYKLKKYNEEIQHFTGYIFIKNGELYYLQTGAYEAETLTESTDPQYFIDNFFLKESHNKKWQIINDTTAAFKVNIPRHYVFRKNSDEKANQNYQAGTYFAGFDDTESSVTLKYYNIPIEDQESTDSLECLTELENIESRLSIDLEMTVKNKNKWFFEGIYEEKSLLVNGFIQMRGNRIYSLYTIDKKEAPNTKKFLKSFGLLPLTTKLSTPVYIVDSLFKSHLPGAIAENRTNQYRHQFTPTLWEHKITSTDVHSGAQYEVFVEKFHSLFGVTDERSFLEKKAIRFNEKDTLAQINEYHVNKEKSLQLYVELNPSDKHYSIKRQLYIVGDYLVTKSVYADSSYFSSPICNQFFEEDEWNSPVTPSLLINKGDSIISLLETRDSSYWIELDKAIDIKYSFQNKHTTLLKNILVSTQWSDSNISFSLQRKLLTSLAALDDGHISNNLADVFRLSPTASPLRTAVLAKLIENGHDKQKFIDTFFDLLMSDGELCYSANKFIFDPFYDHPDLYIENIHHVKRLLDTEKDHVVFWEVALFILNKNEEGKAAVTSIIDSFVKRGETRLNSYSPEHLSHDHTTEFENAAPFHVLDLYQLFSEKKAIITQIDALLARPYVDRISVEATRFLLKKGESIPRNLLKQLLTNHDTWLPTIRLLNEYEFLNSIKNKYYDSEDIAKSILAERLEIDGINASNFKLEDTLLSFCEGEKRLFYVFTFSIDDSPARLGVVGVFSQDKKERHFIDSMNVNYTDYPITKRRRARKSKFLVDELIDEMNDTKLSWKG